MRISDWSSDVCSSDLVFLTVLDYRLGDRVHEAPSEQQLLALIFILQVEHRWRWRQARQIDHQQWLGQLEGRHERRLGLGGRLPELPQRGLGVDRDIKVRTTRLLHATCTLILDWMCSHPLVARPTAHPPSLYT